MLMDSLRHPDLVEMAGELRHVIDAVLGAEQAAAAVAHPRHRTLRDVLIEAEDRGVVVVVDTSTGSPEGRPSVGADHVVVGNSVVPFDSISQVRFR